MSGEEDKYYFPETLNQQERYLGLPLDEILIVAPLIVLGVHNSGLAMGTGQVSKKRAGVLLATEFLLLASPLPFIQSHFPTDT